MPTETPTLTQPSPGLLSTLPLFYIGWSDSILSPSEMTIIRKQLDDATYLTPDEKSYLNKYTDPKHPPSEAVFQEWVQLFRDHADRLDDDAKSSLVDIGLHLARSSTQQHDGVWYDPATRQALGDIQLSMGLDNEVSTNLFLHQIHDHQAGRCRIERLESM